MSWLSSFLVFKNEIREGILLKIMHSIAIKLATGEVTKIMCDFDATLGKFKFWAQYMEHYAVKSKNQKCMSKLSK